MSHADSDSFTFSFPIWIPFISFSCVIVMTATSNTVLNKSGESGYLCLIPDVRRNAFSFSPLRVMLLSYIMISCRFIIYGLYYVEICSLYTHFLESFYHKWMLNFVKRFFSVYIGMIIRFLFLSLLMWCMTLIDLWIFNHPCITGINPTWLWYMILLMYCWILFANILLRIFISLFISSNIGL